MFGFCVNIMLVEKRMYNPDLLTFITVAESGSFANAANKLFISNVAVMKQIDKLEEHLNITLFDRTSKGVSLTKTGRIIYKKALHFIKENDEFMASIQNNSTSDCIRVGLFYKDYISEFHYMLRNYQLQNTRIFDIEIVLLDKQDKIRTSIKNSLIHNNVDFVYAPKLINDISNVSFIPFWDSKICFAVPTNSEISSKKVYLIAIFPIILS